MSPSLDELTTVPNNWLWCRRAELPHTYTFREAGTYLIIVSALSADAVGDFRLVVSGG